MTFLRRCIGRIRTALEPGGLFFWGIACAALLLMLAALIWGAPA